ncbi:MAG: GNAT family N-acetyltransferase [Gemmatimonas sp.]
MSHKVRRALRTQSGRQKMTEYGVEHRADQNRFVIELAGGAALLAYRMTSPGVMNMTSTFVPPAGRGKGTGAKLVEAALNYARDNNLQVIPSCWYVADYIDAHPEYAPLLKSGTEGRDMTGASCEIA